MAAALHAELSTDGRTIVLIGTGTDGDIRRTFRLEDFRQHTRDNPDESKEDK